MKKYSRVLLKSKITNDYWCGQLGWCSDYAKALPMTDEEVAIRIGIEVQLGSPVTAFDTNRVWVNESNRIVCEPK